MVEERASARSTAPAVEPLSDYK